MWISQGTERLNGEQGWWCTGDSKFLCIEYDGRDDMVENDTNSWGRDHSCETGEITTMGNTWGSN